VLIDCQYITTSVHYEQPPAAALPSPRGRWDPPRRHENPRLDRRWRPSRRGITARKNQAIRADVL